jgi:hypothetical protein
MLESQSKNTSLVASVEQQNVLKKSLVSPKSNLSTLDRFSPQVVPENLGKSFIDPKRVFQPFTI